MKKQIDEIIHYNSCKALHIRVKSTLTQLYGYSNSIL